MNFQSKLLIIRNNMLLRMAVGLLVVIIGLFLTNISKDQQFTLLTFLVYASPYLLLFSVLYSCCRMVIARGRFFWLGWLLILFIAGSSYTVVKYYYYDLIPLLMDGFTTQWQPDHRVKLLARILSGLLFFFTIIVADHFGWEYFYCRTLYKKIQFQVHSMSDVQLLSGHFMKRLYNIVRMQRKSVQSESLDFFQYVTDKIARPTLVVPLKEEWHYLKLLISYTTDRNFIVEGDELLDRQMWNRSVPTLSLMTWIENAIAYSPCDSVEPIVIRWCKLQQGMQLHIKNCIASADLRHGTGKGLQLVNRLYEHMNSQFIELDYAIEYQKYFVIKLTFKS